MVETQTELGKKYAALKQQVATGGGPQLIALITAELARVGPNNEIESIRGQYRMFVSLIPFRVKHFDSIKLILVSYYSYYIEQKACAVLQQLYLQKGAGTLETLLGIKSPVISFLSFTNYIYQPIRNGCIPKDRSRSHPRA